MAAKPAPRKAVPTSAPKLPDLVVHECEQGSPEWYEARLGLATASEFGTIMAEGKDGGESKTRTMLMRKLAGEIITGKPAENFVSAAMERGKAMEAEAREHYARTNFVDLTRVGFIYNPAINAGCSPDALIGDDGVLEIKSASAHVLIGILERAGMPPEHRAQCHGSLWVTRRQRCVLRIYADEKMPSFTASIERDPVYEQEIAKAVETFNWELKKLVEKIRAMRK